jgi:hypothetical protein
MRRAKSSRARREASKNRCDKRRKAGIAYQQVVADIARAFSPNAVIREGAWVDGPDGRRDMDVLIEDVVDGRHVKVMVECKDYKPKTQRPLGIEFVDAIAGKVPDLNLTTAAICSNAGFTEGAIRKASRLGIGLVGVMRQGDERIRVKIVEEAYVRNIIPTFGRFEFYTVGVPQHAIDPATVSFAGERVLDLLDRRLSFYLMHNPRVVRASFKDLLRFSEPLTFTYSTGTFQATALALPIEFAGAWYRHLVTYDATNGAFDWIRRRIRITDGPTEVSIGDIDFERGGDYVSQPPEGFFAPIERAEIDFRMVYVHNALPHSKGANSHAIERFLLAGDLGAQIPFASEDNWTSTPGFKRPVRTC